MKDNKGDVMSLGTRLSSENPIRELKCPNSGKIVGFTVNQN
jgi:hypothetical protein